MDAARYGISITVIEDCLGYRVRERHDEALRQLVEIMEAKVLTSRRVLDVLKNPELADTSNSDDDYESEEEDEDKVEDEDRVGEQSKDTNTATGATSARLNDLLVADSDEDEDEEAEIDLIRVRHTYLARSLSFLPSLCICLLSAATAKEGQCTP